MLNYTAAPVFATEERRGRHQWLVEFDDEPAQLEQFARQLDHFLQEACVDYQAKRTGDIFLDAPEVLVARRGLFDQWLASTGKLGGQRKVPRLANDRHLMDDLLSLNA